MKSVQSENSVTTPKGAGRQERAVSALRHNGGWWRRFLSLNIEVIVAGAILASVLSITVYVQAAQKIKGARISPPETPPVRPYPELMRGFYINDEGDSVYRDNSGRDNTIKDCFRAIRDFKTFSADSYAYIGTDLPVCGEAIAAFNNDSLTRSLIYVPTDGIRQKEREKIIALSFLKKASLNEEYRQCIEGIVLLGLESPDEYTRQYSIVLLANWGDFKEVNSTLAQMHDFGFINAIEHNSNMFITTISGIAIDSSRNPYTRMSAAYAVYSITGDSLIVTQTAVNIILASDTTSADSDKLRAYWLAMRWPGIFRDANIVKSLEVLAFINNFLVSDQAVNSLGMMAEHGIVDAENALYYIRLNHPNNLIRSEAARLIP